LNNDTEVKEAWLQNLVEIAERDDKVGVVGGKILFPDGRLQEAGSVMDREGWGQPYGRFDDSDRYEYNYVKETDFITGACLLIRKDAFLKIGGFDERYAPAFYEEFDLEFAMREIGYKIIYQPKAVIVHHQSSSYESEIRDSLSTINHSKFMKKWANQIWGQNANSSIFLARDRSKDKKVILFFDEKVPDYDKHAGSLSTFQYIKLLHEMGFKLIFIPDSLKPLEPYATEMQQAGIEVVYGPFEFENWIKCNGQYIHYVWLSRPDVAIKYVEAIKCYTEAKILYYTVDLHYLRALRRYQIEKGKEILDESMRLKKIEFYLFENVDVILTPSDQEQKIIRSGFPQKRIVTIPVIYCEANSIVGQNLTDFDGRHGIIFLGGFDHLPNVDAVKWFISDIFPVVKQKLPDIKLYIAGSNPPPEIAALNNNDIIVTGYVKDLEQLFKTKRVFVSPLRYGAGVKGKIITSMSYGVPVVTTCVGNEGINLRSGVEAFVADDPIEFANRTVELYTNPKTWVQLSKNSISFVKKNFSKCKAEETILSTLSLFSP
jgi:glycosyltransferase involved in cell wall biosynthesis